MLQRCLGGRGLHKWKRILQYYSMLSSNDKMLPAIRITGFQQTMIASVIQYQRTSLHSRATSYLGMHACPSVLQWTILPPCPLLRKMKAICTIEWQKEGGGWLDFNATMIGTIINISSLAVPVLPDKEGGQLGGSYERMWQWIPPLPIFFLNSLLPSNFVKAASVIFE